MDIIRVSSKGLPMLNETMKLKVLMLPWLAHGHVSPFVELAKEVSQRNIHSYICTTPVILESIKDKLIEGSIDPIELNLPPNPNLPPNLHTTKGLPHKLIPILGESFMSCGPTLSIILDEIRPDLVLYELCGHWIPPIASAQGIPAVFTIPGGAAMHSLLLHSFKHPSHDFPFADCIFLREYYADLTLMATDDQKAFVEQFIMSFDMSSCIILIKGCNAIEGKYINYLSQLCGKKVVAMGPLVQPPNPQLPTTADENIILEWLDKKEPFSTVFVSFGSECYMDKQELEQLAYGLELSNVNFIWVVRFPSVVVEDDDDNCLKLDHKKKPMSIEEAMPSGFLQRVGANECGLVIDQWAPQTRILSHENTGGFVSHCGYSSTMESMYFGVPIIAMPRLYDQPMFARLVEEVGVGVKVLRDEDGKYKSEGVANAIKEVMVNRAEEFRKKANDVSHRVRKEGKEAPIVVAQEIARLTS